MPDTSRTRLARRCRALLGRHLRARVVDSPHRLSRTGLPPKPYDGTDGAVSDPPDANRNRNREG